MRVLYNLARQLSLFFEKCAPTREIIIATKAMAATLPAISVIVCVASRPEQLLLAFPKLVQPYMPNRRQSIIANDKTKIAAAIAAIFLHTWRLGSFISCCPWGYSPCSSMASSRLLSSSLFFLSFSESLRIHITTHDRPIEMRIQIG